MESIICVCSIGILYALYALSHPLFTLVSIDGNIGSGKSTLLAKIQTNMKNIIVIPEPVEEWINTVDEKNNNILQIFYENKTRWGYTFQSFAYITRLILMKQYIDNIKQYKWNILTNIYYRLARKPFIIISERSIFTDRYIFAQMLKDTNCISCIEFNIYLQWFDYFAKDIALDYIIYVRNSPESSMFRINKRHRNEEKEIQKAYIQDVFNYHEDWLITQNFQIKNQVIIIDGEDDFEKDNEASIERLQDHLWTIKHKIKY